MDFVILEDGAFCAINENCIKYITMEREKEYAVDIHAKGKRIITYGKYDTQEEAYDAYVKLTEHLESGTAYQLGGIGGANNNTADYLRIDMFGNKMCVPTREIQCTEVVTRTDSDECVLCINIDSMKKDHYIPLMKKFSGREEAGREAREITAALVEGRVFCLPEFALKRN